MAKKPFTLNQFTPTQFSSSEQKAKFANHFIRFVESGFKRTLFQKWFYRRLSNTFQHIAHYDQYGFWGEWFSSHQNQLRFIEYTLACPCYGHAGHTYCDVEAAIKTYLLAYGALLAGVTKKAHSERNQNAKESAIRTLSQLGPEDRNAVIDSLT